MPLENCRRECSRAHRFRTRAGHAPASPCRTAGLIPPGIPPGGLVIPSSPLVFLSFYLGGRRGGSPHTPAQGSRDLWSFLTFGGLRVSLRWAVCGLRPPGGRLGAGSSAVGRGRGRDWGMCVVDGSVPDIGRCRSWGWGGSVPRRRPRPAAAPSSSGCSRPRLSLQKRCCGSLSPLFAP